MPSPDFIFHGHPAVFVFPDGLLAYDCVTCGSQCCKGHGLSGTRNELIQLVAKRPALAPFVTWRLAEGDVGLDNFAPACFFLADDGACVIHRDEGAAAKPNTCRVFPINRLRVFGGWTFVDVAAEMCPLGIVPGRTTVYYSDFLRDAGGIGKPGALTGRVSSIERKAAERLVHEVRRLRKLIVDSSWDEAVVRLSNSRSLKLTTSSLTQHRKTLASVFGTEPEELSVYDEHLLLAYLPTFRNTWFFALQPKSEAAMEWVLDMASLAAIGLEYLTRAAWTAGSLRMFGTAPRVAGKMMDTLILGALCGIHVKCNFKDLDPPDFAVDTMVRLPEACTNITLGEALASVLPDELVDRARVLRWLAPVALRAFAGQP